MPYEGTIYNALYLNAKLTTEFFEFLVSEHIITPTTFQL